MRRLRSWPPRWFGGRPTGPPEINDSRHRRRRSRAEYRTVETPTVGGLRG